ncbi:MAG: hypothetical protein ACTHJR_16505 [Sphingomonas sp.]|uniref:hypothetical protein n=1 Tax=Sphingomonas sp. TaxID=28214 RepID=UPI003F806E5E
MYWKYSFYELRQKIQLKYGELNATLISQHNSLAMIVAQALGGKTGGTSAPAKDATKGAASVDGAVANINKMLGF